MSADIDPTHLHGQVMKAGVIQPASGSGAPQRRPSAAKTWLKAIELTSRIEAEPHQLFADVVEEWAQRQPGRLALLSGGQSFTYGELAARINRYARWARGQGIRSGRTAFAILVARLEDDLGIDPFTIAEDAAFPSTVGEFVRAYVNVPA
jgi:fatty-acyl-CoA synthase